MRHGNPINLRGAALGLLVSSFVPPIIFSVTSPLSGKQDVVSIVGTILVTSPFSVMFTVLFGLPLCLFAVWLNLVRWWTCFIGGALAGAATLVAVSYPAAYAIDSLLIYGLIGALSGLAFWVCWHLTSGKIIRGDCRKNTASEE